MVSIIGRPQSFGPGLSYGWICLVLLAPRVKPTSDMKAGSYKSGESLRMFWQTFRSCIDPLQQTPKEPRRGRRGRTLEAQRLLHTIHGWRGSEIRVA